MPAPLAAAELQTLLDSTGSRGNPRSSYLGASEIGHKCAAFPLWSLRGFEREAEPRSLRIFELGHKIEQTAVADIGMALLNTDYFMDAEIVSGKQWKAELYSGFVKAHADALLIDRHTLEQVAIIEIKSMASKYFAKLQANGLASMRQYHWQTQAMMGMFDIPYCYFIAYNKDTSEYHVLLEELDPFIYARIKLQFEMALEGKGDRIGKDKSFWRCKPCSKKHVCWNPTYEPKVRNCKQCQNAKPNLTTGKWICQLDGSEAVSPCPLWTRFEPA